MYLSLRFVLGLLEERVLLALFYHFKPFARLSLISLKSLGYGALEW